MPPSARVRRLPRDPQLVATVRARVPLVDASPPLSAPVRGVEALARRGDRLVVLRAEPPALSVGPAGDVEVLPWPEGCEDARVTAVVVLDGVIVGIGRGARPAEERWVVWGGDDPPQWADAATVHAALRASVGDLRFDVVGAALGEDRLVLVQAGPGDVDTLALLDADVVPAVLEGAAVVPTIRRVVTVALGDLGDRRPRIAELAETARGLAFVADTGAVGWMDAVSGGWTPLREPDGRFVRGRAAGIAFAGPDEVWIACDPEDPARPAELLRVRLEGFPWSATRGAGGAP